MTEPDYKVRYDKSRSIWDTKTLVKRLLWECLGSPVLSLTPRYGNWLRVATLRLFGAKIGKRCLVRERVKVLMPWNLELGDFVAIGHHVEIYNYDRVSVASMTCVSQYCYLCTGSHDYTKPNHPLIWKPIIIGSQCWVAASAFIAPGVTIADGCVIGACSVVTKDMPEWMVCAGNPCKPLKAREMKDV